MYNFWTFNHILASILSILSLALVLTFMQYDNSYEEFWSIYLTSLLAIGIVLAATGILILIIYLFNN